MNLWDLTVGCNTCEHVEYIEEMYIVPNKGKFLCKACSLNEGEHVIPMTDIDDAEEQVDHDELAERQEAHYMARPELKPDDPVREMRMIESETWKRYLKGELDPRKREF
jgi:hypothetical protein